MKTKSLIIFVLTATLFVACSKKKDDAAKHPPTPTYPGAYPNGQYPNGMIPPGLNTNGMIDMRAGLHQNNCYQTQALNCRNTAPIFCEDFNTFQQTGQMALVRYCNWLYEEGRHECNAGMVRDAYMRNCMHLSAGHNNFCGTYFSASYGFRVSGYSGYRRSSTSSSGNYPIYLDGKGRGSSGTTTATRPAQSVVTQPTAPAPVSTAPTTVAATPAASVPSKDCVDEQVDSISRLKIRVKSNEDFKDNLSVSCLLDYTESCRVTEPLRSGMRIKPSIKISDRNNDDQLKRSFTTLLQASLDNKLSCKFAGEKQSKVSYQSIKDRCEISGSRTVVRCQEPAAAPVVAAAPVAPVAPAPVGLRASVLPGVFEDVPEDKFKDCINIERLHNHLKNKNNSVVSFSRKYIDSPAATGLTTLDKQYVVNEAYSLPAGSNKEQLKLNANEGSAFGVNLVQTTKGFLAIDHSKGQITACKDNWLEAELATEKGQLYKVRFVQTPGSTGSNGSMTLTIFGDINLPTKGNSRYLTVSLINWITNEELEKRDLKIVELNSVLLRGLAYNVDNLLKNTGEIIRNPLRKGNN